MQSQHPRIMRNGRLVSAKRAVELALLSDVDLLRRMTIACDMCITLDTVEREFGWVWRGHERTHWPLLYEDYCQEAIARGLL